MDIAILGAGRMGSGLAGHLAQAGHVVRISNGKDPEALRKRLGDLAAHVETTSIADAVAPAAVVFLAVMWSDKEAAIAAAGANAFAGKILVDLSNPYALKGDSYEVVDLGGRPTSAVVAELVSGARLVKAFNTLNWEPLAHEARPAGASGRLAVPVASDDADAKAMIMRLIDAMGFDPVDAGTIAESRFRQEPGCPLYNRNLTAAQTLSELAKIGGRLEGSAA